MRKRGYRFVTLEEALNDSAYALPDTYVGEEGTGWLDHSGYRTRETASRRTGVSTVGH